MAEEALNKSLDDLIKEQRNKQSKGKAAKGTGSRGGRTVKPIRRGASSGSASKMSDRGRRSSSGVSTPKIVQVASAGAASKKSHRRKKTTETATMIIDNATMAHAKPSVKQAAANRLASHLGTKLFISNLDYKVSGDDVRELFGTVGPLVSSSVHYKRTGASAGTAEAVFHSRADAVKALERYGNVQLDGRPMKIELIEQVAAPIPAERTLRSGIVITRRSAGSQSGSRGGRRKFHNRQVVNRNAMQE